MRVRSGFPYGAVVEQRSVEIIVSRISRRWQAILRDAGLNRDDMSACER